MTSTDQGTALDTRKLLADWLDTFSSALDAQDYARAASMFADESYWRDLLALTWDIRTFQGPREIELALAKTVATSGVANFVLEDRDPTRTTLGEYGEVVQSYFGFTTTLARGRGFLRLLPDPDRTGSFKAFTLLTAVEELVGHPERIGVLRPRENLHAPERGVQNWLDRRTAAGKFVDADPEVLVIGAGQSGFTVAARLGALGVSTLVVDRIENVGDNWRNRYHSLTLHNELCVNHLPYMPFPETFPVYIPKDMLADWFQAYAKAMELNVWTSTEFLGGKYDDSAKRWTVRLRRADGSIRTMRPSHVVLAVGVAGLPNIPVLAGHDDFAGTVMHSSGPTSSLDVAGKKVVVVGSANSAHDIAQDLYLRGADVTMLQRSSTTVVGLEPSSSRVFANYTSGEGVRPLDDTDLMSASVPTELMRRMHIPLSKQMQLDDKELLDGLRRVGFALDNGEDDSGFYMKFMRYFGRYYINVGASDLIVDGKIKLRSGVGVDHLTSTDVVLTDGSAMPANIVVLATGYHPLQEAVRSMFGSDIADRVGPIWGPGVDGEMRGMWARTGQEHFYIHGGGLAMCRIYSKYLALQIKAELEGLIPPKQDFAPNSEL